MPYISGAVEGPSDDAVFRRLVSHCGGQIHRVQVQGGKDGLRRALRGYNSAAQRTPWLVLVDLDQDFACAPALVRDWLPAPGTYMRFRVVVRQLEAWLLADAERFARFFKVRPSAVPAAPDELDDARTALLNVIQGSTRRAICEDMLPRARSGRRVGPAYTSRLIEFGSDSETGWRPDVAARHSPSLERCVKSVRELIAMAP